MSHFLYPIFKPFSRAYECHSIGVTGVARFWRENLISPCPLGTFFNLFSIIFTAGFRLNASSWPMFLLKTLNGAEMAPIKIFHKVYYFSAIMICKLLKNQTTSQAAVVNAFNPRTQVAEAGESLSLTSAWSTD